MTMPKTLLAAAVLFALAACQPNDANQANAAQPLVQEDPPPPNEDEDYFYELVRLDELTQRRGVQQRDITGRDDDRPLEVATGAGQGGPGQQRRPGLLLRVENAERAARGERPGLREQVEVRIGCAAVGTERD